MYRSTAFSFRGHDFRCYLGYPHVDCNSSNLLFVSALFRPISICFRGTKYEVTVNISSQTLNNTT